MSAKFLAAGRFETAIFKIKIAWGVLYMSLDSETLERVAGESHQQRRLDELARRIRKLRWMGMDEEAEELQNMLPEFRQAPILLSGPNDTD